ncbi:AraC family transcriptional regulator [Spongiibacter sp. UBA1325]|uniref:AraC family transcriptional regulator n=2 Tax=Spongiibacter TaxID=630749 RepID=UPI00257ECAB8|nr:AraC family transcriptional regulator [Spongiibacter sp. UBA1325]|tara:strand:- start:3248 stop:4336 length:1089 start_codon:yes stop_codon:yes gene_type:complete
MTMPQPTAMHEMPVRKFLRLLDYLDKVGIDQRAIAKRSGLNIDDLMAAEDDKMLPGYRYSSLYELAAEAMQQLNIAVPWGSGIGSDVFRFMCYSIINCQTLEDALHRAQRYQEMLYSMTGYRIELIVDAGTAELIYHFDADKISPEFLPDSWDRTEFSDTVAKASGMRVWHAFMGWLVGRDIELSGLKIAAPEFSYAYSDSVNSVMGVPPQYDCDYTAICFPAECLRYRTVHTSESLEAFLRNAVYALISQDSRPASTGAAIRSLLAKSGAGALPSFEDMAENLHMSPSSLRRRLNSEGTSYQELKDHYRRDIAMRHLRDDKLKIHEIGELLGFLESSSFIRSFRNWTGLTPKQYRSEFIDD